MTWYCFTMTGKSKWKTCLADHRQEMLEQDKPEYMTVLDVNHPCTDGEIPDNLFYRGPMYFDWDGEDDLEGVLDDVRRFMGMLEGWDFDLNQASWYLSGKKGVHCTIPMECLFDAKVCKSGIKDLFRLYGKFAWEHATTYMDMRVYSGRRGRMWRTTCLPRQVNGQDAYKVPVTAAQLKELDAEGYRQWCSQPRQVAAPAEPTYNLQLATELQVLHSQLLESSRETKKRRSNPEIFKDWNGEVPPTIQAAFDGHNIDMSCGLNDVGLQFATAAIALGLDSFDRTDDFLKMCEGFIQARIGQAGVAHSTRQSIVQRLTQSFHYCLHNPSYVYAPELFAGILQHGVRDNLDLQGIKPGQGEAEMAELALSLQAGFAVDTKAVYKQTRDGTDAVMDYSWKPESLQVIRSPDGMITHYSVVAVLKGKELPPKTIPVSTLINTKEFTAYLAGLGGTHLLSSAPQLAAVRKALLNYVGGDSAAREITSTKCEGLYVKALGVPEDGDYHCEMYWVEPNTTVRSPLHKSADPVQPTYLDTNNPQGQFGVDLSGAFAIQDYQSENETLVQHLLDLNGDTYSLAMMLAWFTACTLKHPLYVLKRIKNFPILQIVGQAGCGKTTTANILLHLFTWAKDFRVNIAGRNLTAFSLASLSTASTTVPVVIDEVKPQNLGSQYMADFRGFLQTIYTIGSEAKRGGGDGSTTASYKTISQEAMLAPVCFLAEALEASQASLLERSVVASFHKDAVFGRAEHARFLGQHERHIGMLGWGIVQHLMSYDLTRLVQMHDAAITESEALLSEGNNYRVIENAAMMFVGLKFFGEVLEAYFPQRFTEKIEALGHALRNPDRWLTRVSSEIVRLLSLLSNASHETDDSRSVCRKDYHYTVEAGDSSSGRVEYLIIQVERCFYLYRERMKAMGLNPAFGSAEEMQFALRNSPMAVDTLNHPVLTGICIKLNPEVLQKENVEKFR